MKDDLLDKLTEYSKSDYYPLHMPGHKRNINMFEEKYGFHIDITEIDGFDELYDAKGILKEAMDNATQFFHTEKTWFLVNGSTTGILTAMHSCLEQGDNVIIGRNCHKSVYNASGLLNLNNHYLYPEYVEEYGINGGYNVRDLEKIFEKNPGIKAVIITSPTYDGIVSDIVKIAQITHNNGAVLIVDEAHGAHFGMSKYFPKAAYELGADIVIESMHKTLPAFTQTALLHVSKEGKKRIDLDKVDYYWSVFQTSSPSYIFMANIDRCIRMLQENGERIYRDFAENIKEFRSKCISLHNIKIPGKELIGCKSIFDIDESRIIVHSSISGKQMYDVLREKYHLQMEMEAANYALAIMSIGDEWNGFERLHEALSEMDKCLNFKVQNNNFDRFALVKSKKEMSISQALVSRKKKIEIENADGKVAASYLYLYPPGIPLIVPGEIIRKEINHQVQKYVDMGFQVKGSDIFEIVINNER